MLKCVPQIRLGWPEAAMIAGAREVGVSPSIVGSFPSKEAALVEVMYNHSCLLGFSIINSFFRLCW